MVAQADERVGELGSLLGCVDLFCDGGEGVPAPVGVVPGDGLLQAFEVGADELGESDQQREISCNQFFGSQDPTVRRAPSPSVSGSRSR